VNAQRYADAFYGISENAEMTITEENKLSVRNQTGGMIVEETVLLE
jgi:hypothetical protein